MKVEAKKLELSTQTTLLALAFVAIGVVSFFLGLSSDAPRIWRAFLLNHLFFMGLSIGAIFFLVIHYLSSSGWVVAVRRVTESIANYFMVAALFTVVIFFGLSKIYPWTNPEFMNEHALHHKIAYFSNTFSWLVWWLFLL